VREIAKAKTSMHVQAYSFTSSQVEITRPGIRRGARRFSTPRDESHHCSGGWRTNTSRRSAVSSGPLRQRGSRDGYYTWEPWMWNRRWDRHQRSDRTRSRQI